MHNKVKMAYGRCSIIEDCQTNLGKRSLARMWSQCKPIKLWEAGWVILKKFLVPPKPEHT